jgi:hypothetical protein
LAGGTSRSRPRRIRYTIEKSTGASYGNRPLHARLEFLTPSGVVVATDSLIKRYDAQGGVVRTYDWSGHNHWFALALDPDGTSFWAGDAVTGQVYRFDLATGNKLASFSTGFTELACTGKAAVGGISILPDIVGAGSLTVPNSSEVSPKVQGDKLPGPVPESSAGPSA